MAVFILVLIFVSQLFSSKLTDKENQVRDISAQEVVALDSFRELMGDALYKDYMKSDAYLLRWLKEKNFDPVGASKMLHKALKWRKENSIDTILDEVLCDTEKLPYKIMNGSDYEGNMVTVAMLAKFDARDFILTGKKEIITRLFSQMWESVETTIMKRTGLIGNTPIHGATDKGTFLIDSDGYNLRQHACQALVDSYRAVSEILIQLHHNPEGIPVFLQLFEIMEYYYPGYAKHYLFINVPRVFHPLLELGKPIMSRQTKKVMQVFSSNKKEWRGVLTNIIPENQLKTLGLLS